MLNITLKELRKTKGITQEQLADALNVERSSIGKYESPKKPVMPSSDVLMRMSDYFGVTIDYLLGRTDSPAPPDEKKDGDDIKLSDIEFALYGEIRELTEEDKEELLRDARRMRELIELRKKQREQE